MLENFQENVELRGMQFQESKNFEPGEEEEEDEGDEYDAPSDATTRGVTIAHSLIHFRACAKEEHLFSPSRRIRPSCRTF